MNILLVSSVVFLAIRINLVVCSSNSIVISSNSIVILSNFIVVSKEWRMLRWNSMVVYKKPPSAPYVAFLVELTSFMYLLASIQLDPQEKKLFNDVPNFKIRKLNFQVIQRFTLILFIPHPLFFELIGSTKAENSSHTIVIVWTLVPGSGICWLAEINWNNEI